MSTIGDVSTISAGWYPDPQDASRSRWWDGMSWTASVSDREPPAPAAKTFVEPQQYVQQPFTPVAPAVAGSGLAVTRRQLREQSEQLALAASTPQSADTGVIARSAHAAEPMPQIPAPVKLVAPHVAQVAEAPAVPTFVDTSAAAVPFDWSPNAVMPTRVEAPAPAPAPAPVATVATTTRVEPLSNYAALVALFGSVETQRPEPTGDAEKAKAPVAQFDYAASFANESAGGLNTFGGQTAPGAREAAVPRSTLAVNTLAVNTGAIWIFAIMPILQIGLAWLAFDYLGLTAGGIPLIGFLVVLLLLYLILAGIDRRSLSNNGHPRVPSLLWAIVPPFYLIARIVRTGRRSVAPLLVWLLTQGAIVAAAVLLAMPLILTLMSMASTTSEPPVVPVAPTEPTATSVCTYMVDGVATEYIQTLGTVIVVP